MSAVTYAAKVLLRAILMDIVDETTVAGGAERIDQMATRVGSDSCFNLPIRTQLTRVLT
jgi:hypothetical protein